MEAGRPWMEHLWVLAGRAGSVAWSRSSACYEDALSEAVEGGEAVGSSFDHLDLVGDAFGVAVGDRLVEVGEQFFAPEPGCLRRRRCRTGSPLGRRRRGSARAVARLRCGWSSG